MGIGIALCQLSIAPRLLIFFLLVFAFQCDPRIISSFRMHLNGFPSIWLQNVMVCICKVPAGKGGGRCIVVTDTITYTRMCACVCVCMCGHPWKNGRQLSGLFVRSIHSEKSQPPLHSADISLNSEWKKKGLNK